MSLSDSSFQKGKVSLLRRDPFQGKRQPMPFTDRGHVPAAGTNLASAPLPLPAGRAGLGGRHLPVPSQNLLTEQVQTHISDGVRVAFSTSACCVSKKSAPTRLSLGSADHDHSLGFHPACPCPPPPPPHLPPVSHLRPFLPLSVISEARWKVATEQPATMDVRRSACFPYGHQSEIRLSSHGKRFLNTFFVGASFY